jgi:DNA-binding NarL/FixJ family response regulator
MAHVLIVEDEEILNQAYKMVLEKEGYDIACAYNGEEGLKLALKKEPDLILLDLLMPTMNGIEFLQHYQLPEKHPKVKVIIFSNLDMQREIDEAYKLGAHRYILKAWASPKELVRVVADTLAEKSTEPEAKPKSAKKVAKDLAGRD